MDAFEAIRSRRSIRSFRPEPVARELIEQVVDAGRLAPNAKNRQEWEFVVVTDEGLIKRIAQIWSAAARRFYLSMSKEEMEKDFARQASDSRGENWASRSVSGQAYENAYGAPVLVVVFIGRPEIKENLPSGFLAVENMVLAAQALGLGSLVATRPVTEPADADCIRQMLHVPAGYLPVAIVPLGYPLKRPGAIEKRPLSEVLHYNYYGQREWQEPSDD
jgi:nitroreductase